MLFYLGYTCIKMIKKSISLFLCSSSSSGGVCARVRVCVRARAAHCVSMRTHACLPVYRSARRGVPGSCV